MKRVILTFRYIPMLVILLFLTAPLISKDAWALTWTQTNSDGFGDSNNTHIASLCAYGDKLYAGTANSSGAEMWEYDGSSWTMVIDGGIGDINNYSIKSMAVYDGFLFLGTSSNTTAEVWRYDGSAWLQVADNGFGDANSSVTSLTVYDGELYAGTYHDTNAAEVWKYNGTSWTETNTGGFGPDIHNWYVGDLEVFQGYLYAGLSNNSFPSDGGELWRYEGDAWVQIPDSFSSNVRAIEALETFGDYLMIGVENYNGTEVWSFDGASSWTQLMSGGFGNPNNTRVYALKSYNGMLYAGTYNTVHEGGQVWEYTGSSWSQVNVTGFGDPDGYNEILSLEIYDGELFAGTHNFDDGKVGHFGAGEVWATYLSADISVDIASDESQIPAGTQVSFEITVANDGPDHAGNIIVQLHLPTGSTYVSSTGNQWDCTSEGSLVTCSRLFLDAGHQTTIEVVVLVPGTEDNISFDVEASADAVDEILQNNTDSIQIEVEALVGTGQNICVYFWIAAIMLAASTIHLRATNGYELGVRKNTTLHPTDLSYKTSNLQNNPS